MPEFVFVSGDGAGTRVDLNSESGNIRAMAEYLQGEITRGAAVGLLFRSEPDLLRLWLASLIAGLRPLILQYPTRKQNRDYWTESVLQTVQGTGLAAIIADVYCAGLGLQRATRIIGRNELASLPPLQPGPVIPDAFEILQLSSGTTGHRKAMSFSSAQLTRHITDYDLALGLQRDDILVSWLPLYHDMGYIACLVMPLLLGVPVVMMDPMTWVARPELLFEVVERYRCTTCYMPNFGFEVMARSAPRPLPSMRRWISSSEPVSARTARRFLAAIGAGDEVFRPCYAMAENVFAVTLGQGLKTRTVEGCEMLSCGMPIPNVDLKLVDGEIWVRSPVSIVAYLHGADIRDDFGFYPTGDLGHLIDGALYVAGRRHDVLVQAGRKFFLSDLDRRLNELRPEVRGRAATVPMWDERLGTETPTVLIESDDFISRSDQPEIAAQIRDATGLDAVDVAFVPRRFLTKTSSGKINRRRSRDDFRASVEHRARRSSSVQSSPVEQLRANFAALRWDRPVGEVLDSLSTVILRVALEGTEVAYDRRLTLGQIAARLEEAGAASSLGTPDSVRLVSLADRFTLDRLGQPDLDRLTAILGCPVTFEHVCLPPSPVILSDLVFQDFFQPRVEQDHFGSVNRTLDRLRGASALVTDDMAEMFFLYESTYAVLSHALRRDPNADLISVRWQEYPRLHDRLPATVVAGIDIPLSASTATLDRVAALLHVPVFRIANVPGFADFTTNWEYRPLGAHGAPATDPAALIERLGAWLADRQQVLERRALRPGPALQMSELAHFCSSSVRKEAVDALVDRYERFCVVGQPASVPYMRHAITRAGKRFVQVPSFAETTLAQVEEPYDCLVACGAFGDTATDKPVVALQHVGQPWRSRNLAGFEADLLPLNDVPVSGDDWFHGFDLARLQDYQVWSKARAAVLPRLSAA